jgi:Zn-dependent protease with chaperone function
MKGTTWFAVWQRRLSEKRGGQLFREALEREVAPPDPSWGRLLVLLAIAVRFGWCLILGACVALLLTFGWTLWTGLVAFFGLLFAFVSVPRRPPLEGQRLHPDRSPELHGLVQRVAEAVEAPLPDRILLSDDFNAFVTIRKGERVLVLGLPILVALGPQGRVALIAHELAHFRNGDVSRSGLVDPALWLLAVWVELLRPHAFWAEGESPAEAVANVAMYVLSVPPTIVLRTMHFLFFDDSQRAEYFADLCGAQVSGTAAFVEFLSQLLHHQDLELAMHAVVVKKEAEDVLEVLSTRARARSDEEIARAIAAAAEEESSIDHTHPPTGLRIRLLRARPSPAPKVVLEPEANARIDQELGEASRGIERQLRLRYRLEVLGE